MALRDLKSVIYTDDFSRQYACKMDASVFAQVGASTNRKVGGADYTGSPALPPLPAQLVPRHVVVTVPGDKRKVVCLTAAAELFTGTETTIDLPVLGGAAVTYTRAGSVAEAGYIKHDPNQ